MQHFLKFSTFFHSKLHFNPSAQTKKRSSIDGEEF